MLEVDTRWYKSLDEDPEASETWRDPFVFREPDGDGWHMLVTARARGGARRRLRARPRAERGPGDLGGRSARVCAGPCLGQLEVAQVREIEGRRVLGPWDIDPLPVHLDGGRLVADATA